MYGGTPIGGSPTTMWLCRTAVQLYPHSYAARAAVQQPPQQTANWRGQQAERKDEALEEHERHCSSGNRQGVPGIAAEVTERFACAYCEHGPVW